MCLNKLAIKDMLTQSEAYLVCACIMQCYHDQVLIKSGVPSAVEPATDLQPPASKKPCVSTPPCHVEHHLVDLIRWKEKDGAIMELEIQSSRAQSWTRSAAQLGFELKDIKSTAENHENEASVAATSSSVNQGIDDTHDSSDYPKSWQELSSLLEEGNLNEVAKELSGTHRTE